MITQIKSYINAIIKRDLYKQKIYPDINYYNFWPIDRNKVQDVWLANFIQLYKKSTIDYNVFSVFGNKNIVKFVKEPKIFFTGENIHTKIVNAHFDEINIEYFKHFNLAIGFDFNEVINQVNYIRFPLWIMYLFPFDSTYEDIKRIINNINSIENRLGTTRARFATNISRHDNNGIRSEIVDVLQNIGNIECAGDFRNNTNALRQEFNDDKFRYLKTVRYNICPENSNHYGYVTEKLFESIQAGSLPVYWGSENKPEQDILNPDAILFYDPNNPRYLFNRVYELENDIKSYNEFISGKPFKDKAEDLIWGKFEELKKRISNVD